MDDDDEFFDTISVTSGVSRRRFDSRDYLSLSRNTVYHSAVDLETMELTRLNGDEEGNSQNKQWHCFKNGGHYVDFVLAYDKEGDPDDIEKRNRYEARLKKAGLLLEKEENQRIHFVKIHVPRETLCQYADILKLRLPIKTEAEPPKSSNCFSNCISKVLDCLHVKLDPKIFPPRKYTLTAEFSKDKNYLFDVDAPDFFNESVRLYVASYILERVKYGKREDGKGEDGKGEGGKGEDGKGEDGKGEDGKDDQDRGIHRLISEGIYKAAYPLHDGDLKGTSKRALLFKHWAQVSKCIKYQPIDDIKDYFGVKFALYFTWLGFYTHMLIPACLVGIFCLVYGAMTVTSDTLSTDICSTDVIMCPRCDKVCDYWELKDGCLYSKMQHFVDNPATIFFAVFMSFWSVLYLELWKRYSAEIAHRWGLTGLDLRAEPPRPQYLIRLAGAKKKKLNAITKLEEPFVSFWKRKLPSIIFSFTVVIMWVLIAVFVVFGVVVYRMSLITSEVLYNDRVSYRIYILPITAGVINLVTITILNILYKILAVWLTEKEFHRTQTEYEDSLALKIYMFKFVNYYSSIFYIAFLKGKFVGYPAKYNRIFGFRQEECNPGGCLMELMIQLAIIMVGNQAINAVAEMLIPFLLKIFKTARCKMGLRKDSDEKPIVSCNQWTEDYKLADLESQSLMSEYLEMILQYGFVTIFVTAFPLAPFFALINNVIEMRLDAKKFIKFYRRPVPQQVKDLGVWFRIMGILGRISVVSNAFIIAFSSHFIPKLVYTAAVNLETHTDDGFLEHSLAYFDTHDFENGTAPDNPTYDVSICRYPEYRNSFNVTDPALKYKRPLIYWHILAARLAFVVAYQNIVSFVVLFVEWVIPDVPRKLSDQIKMEEYNTKEVIIKNETERANLRPSKNKNRDSVHSGETVYSGANGGFHPNTANTSNPEGHIQDMGDS